MIIYEDEELVIPAGLAHSLSVDDIVNNDTIAVTITENGIRVLTPDASYTGFSRVTIDTSVNLTTQDKAVDSSTEAQRISADAGYDALGEVTVLPYVLDTPKTLDSSTNPQVIIPVNDGLSKVIVNPYVIDTPKTVDSSTNPQVILPENDGISKVIVNPYTLDAPKTVDSSTNRQVILPVNDGLSKVVVNPYTLDTPKTVDSSTNSQVIIPVNDGLSKVIVNPYTLDSSSLVITESGSYRVTSEVDGLSSVDVSVNIDTEAYYNEGYSNGEAAGITKGMEAQKALLDSSTFTKNGTYSRENGFSRVTIDVQPTLQAKTVDSSTERQLVTPTDGYDGLSSVEVKPYELDVKTVDSSTVAQVVESDVDGLKEVHINPFALENLVLDSSTIYQEYTPTTGFGTVKVTPYTLQSKTLTINQRGQHIITPDNNYDGLSSVILNTETTPALQIKRVDSSTVTQTVVPDSSYDGLSSVIVNSYTTEVKTVKSSAATQVITPTNANAISKIVVNPYAMQNASVTISQNGLTTVYPDTETYDGIGKISITTNVQPALQSKSVDASIYSQTVTPDANYYGLSKVVVSPMALSTKTVDLTQNGTFEYLPSGDGFSKFTVRNNTNPVNNQNKEVELIANNTTTYIDADSGYTGLGRVTVHTAIPSDINNQRKVINITSNGTSTITPDEGYTGLSKVEITTGVYPKVQSKVVSSSTQTQVVAPDTDYEYLSAVTINPYVLDNIAVDASISSQVFYPTHDGFASFTVNPVINLAAGNIRQGVTILGITGTFQGGELQERTLNSSTNLQEITPTSGYYGISKVTVNPYTLQAKTVNSSTSNQTVTADNGYDGLSSVTVNKYVLDEKTVYPRTSQQIVTSDVDGLSSVTVKAVTSSIDPNIKAENIKKGVQILGITGNMVQLVGETREYDLYFDSNDELILPTQGYNGITSLNINATKLASQRDEIYNRLASL